MRLITDQIVPVQHTGSYVSVASDYNASVQTITILVVDDHPVVRAGISALLSVGNGFTVIAQAASGEEAIQQHARHNPDVTLMDLRLPGTSGVEAIRQIRLRNLKANIIVLTTYEGDEDIYQAVQAGAAGYLIKNMPEEVLYKAIRRVHEGKRYLPPPILDTLNARIPSSSLSRREIDVIKAVARGLSNLEIAGELGISEGTVKWHVSVILTRLNVRDRTQAVVLASQRGLLHL